MTEACDLCGDYELRFLYEAEDSQRGLKVFACKSCGLMQSLPRRDRAPRANASISAGADWGNLRYGKGFRVPAHLKLLASQESLHSSMEILDVGANRGAFLDAALKQWPEAHITAVEPDERVTQSYGDRPHVALAPRRIEDCAFSEGVFDLLYSSHTLEHVAEARRVMMLQAKWLKPSGLTLIEVPNNALLASPDIVEEWFIDKHLFHYSANTLCALLEVAGFERVQGPDENDKEYLTVLARKRAGASADARPTFDPGEFVRSASLVSAYQSHRRFNVAALKSAARAIEGHKGRVVIWGGGRLFDSLVRIGGLDTRKLAGLIDENLRAHVAERHGVKVLPSGALPKLGADLIVIASRSFAGEIADQARRLAPRAKLLTFTELLLEAQRSAA